MERCNKCNCEVDPNDLYFATPCGTYCDWCMNEVHAKECEICAHECEICAHEFELDVNDEETS